MHRHVGGVQPVSVICRGMGELEVCFPNDAAEFCANPFSAHISRMQSKRWKRAIGKKAVAGKRVGFGLEWTDRCFDERSKQKVKLHVCGDGTGRFAQTRVLCRFS
jgi:hypothetical protein